jgi:hypothetical protein
MPTQASARSWAGLLVVVHSERLAGTGGRARIRGRAVEASKGSGLRDAPVGCWFCSEAVSRPAAKSVRDRRVSSSRAPPVRGWPRAASADALR